MQLPGPPMPFAPNPNYGSGAARRTIRLSKRQAGVVEAHLVDNYHEMRCVLSHDGRVVTDVAGEMIRFPTTACPGAPEALRELIGLPLATPLAELYEAGRVRRNCTHLFDSAVSAMRHAAHDRQRTIYEAVVPDETCEPIWVEVRRNDQIVHRWRVEGDRIISPVNLAGMPMLKGFTRWTGEMFKGDALEAALILGKTCFIATVRPYSPEGSAGEPIRANAVLVGSCYAYAPGHIEHAVLTDKVGEVRGPPSLDNGTYAQLSQKHDRRQVRPEPC